MFAPTEVEVEVARRIIETFAAAADAGSALAVLDGKLVEELHVRQAERLVALSEAVRLAAVPE